jgi:cellobiose transport system substrate-binding protein
MLTKSRNRRLAAVATASALALVLAACSTGDAPTGSSGASGAAADLTMWVWPGALSETTLEAVAADYTGGKLSTSVIGDNFKTKLLTSFTANSNIPDITGVKGEDMPYFLQKPELFTDLNTLGISDMLSEFPEWKLKEAMTPDGKLLGLPIDIGPTGLFYREDVLAKAGLPTDPAELQKATSTWEDYLAFGEKLKGATGAFLDVNMADVFSFVMAQNPTKFVSPDGEFLGDSPEVRRAWDLAVEAQKRGLTAGLQDGSPDWASAVLAGTLPTVLGASWHAGDLKSSVADTAGKWRVTQMPGGPANVGGSFLTIPSASKDKEAAIGIIRELLSAENQATMFTDTGNFPARTTAFEEPAMKAPDPFFGDQDVVSQFALASKNMPIVYNSPLDNVVAAAFYSELSNIESAGKDPEQAWRDAVQAASEALASSK